MNLGTFNQKTRGARALLVTPVPLVLATLLHKLELQLPLGYFYASTITFISKQND